MTEEKDAIEQFTAEAWALVDKWRRWARENDEVGADADAEDLASLLVRYGLRRPAQNP